MALSTTPLAWSGSYSGFHEFRCAIAAALNWEVELKKKEGESRIASRDYTITAFDGKNPGLYLLLAHSDCDGFIPWEICGMIADELAPLADRIVESHAYLGQLAPAPAARVQGRSIVTQFIHGCLEAFETETNMEFH